MGESGLDSKACIDHFALTITTKAADDDEEIRMLSASAVYLAKDEDDNEDVLRATIANETGENAYKITVAMAARDVEGKLLYIATDATRDIGLSSGGSLLVRSIIKSDIEDELEDTNVQIGSAEAFAYTIEDTDDD